MAIKFFALILFFISNAFALEGTVIVLEAPLFHKPDENSKVIQYIRVGHKVEIHNAETQKTNFHLRHEKVKVTDESTQAYDEYYQDPLFQKPEDTYRKDPSSRFYQTLDKRGRVAYILKEHIEFVYDESNPLFDPTDYRIPEPLPPQYPLIQPSGYKGYLGFGVGLPNDKFYPAGTLQDQTTNPSFQVHFNWSKEFDFDKERRFHWGFKGLYEAYKNTALATSYQLEEDTKRFAIGPELTYDIFRAPKYIINASLAALINLFYVKTVEKEQLTTKASEQLDYKAFFISPAATFSWQYLDIGPNMDFVLGGQVLMDLPHQMKGKEGYEQDLSLNFSLFFAISTKY